MSGSSSFDPMAILQGLFGRANPASTDVAPGVPDYSNFVGQLGPTQSGAPLGTMGASSTPGSGLGAGFGMNIGTGQLALGGLQSLGQLWNAFQANNLAKKSFDFTKQVTNTNLNNQTQAYNTNLAGMADARFAQENKTPQAAAAYTAANSLPKTTLG